MHGEHQIIKEVYAAKKDSQKADDFIRAYIPFIRSEATKYMARFCTEQDDEFSIAMMGFYEAIMGYEKERGAFLSYAEMIIRSRLIDYGRKEAHHKGNISLDEKSGDDERTVGDKLAEKEDFTEDIVIREATRKEINELSETMEKFGINFSDVAENSPKQERTMKSCAAAIRFSGENPEILEELLRTGKLPLSKIVSGSGIERKTLERHRKYILAMLLIQTNGYEIIRGHLKRVLKRREAEIG